MNQNKEIEESEIPDNWRELATVPPRTAALILGLSQTSIYESIGRNEIPHRRIGRRLLIPVASLRTWLGEVSENTNVG